MGVFTRMMEGLSAQKAEPQTVMIDATCLKAHRTASSLGVKRGHCQVNGPRPSGAWKRRSYLSAVDAAFHSAIAAARNWRIVFREIR